MTPRALTVAGVMSGTSADGIDVALMRIEAGSRPGAKSRAGIGHPDSIRPKLTLLAHEGFPFPAALRRSVLAAMNAERISTAELARLNWRLGLEYAHAVKRTIGKHKTQVDLIGCHGQTLYHQGAAARYAGEVFACTWQAGEAAVVAQQLGVPVVSNFRPADMAAGGQGAPLVPLLDYVLFADAKRGRVLQNIGGIGNLTAIPAGAGATDLVAFDTGPGNMVIDALAQQLFGKKYDRNGAIAAQGLVLADVVEAELRLPFYRREPPRSAGREQFGREYAGRFLAACRKLSRRPEDALATATALTAESIARSYKRFVQARLEARPVDYILSGGGARNATLVEMLTSRLGPLGCQVSTSSEHGLPVEAKEAAAFALLAWMTWHRLAGNVPAATGARRPVVLGQVTYV